MDEEHLILRAEWQEGSSRTAFAFEHAPGLELVVCLIAPLSAVRFRRTPSEKLPTVYTKALSVANLSIGPVLADSAMGALGTKVLNPAASNTKDENADAEPLDAGRVAKDVNSKILRIYGKFLSEDGSAVDYGGIASSPEFAEWKKLLLSLHHVRFCPPS